MTYFITIEELKQTTFNTNLDNEYIAPALEEAQSIYLREIIGDLLYTSITNKIDSETLSDKYLTLVNQYIKPYLTYKVQSVIVIPLNNKTRNAGVINQYDQGFNTSTMKDTAYLADHYNSRAEFYANRLTTYLQKNSADFPEYGYSDDNITQPTDTQNVTTIYLGGSRKKGCGCNTSTGSASAKTVDWDNITNRPDFATVATTADYTDLINTPTNVSDFANDAGYTTFDGDYNSLTNKPTIPTVPTNVSAFNNDAGYTTFDGDYNSLTNKPSIPAAQVQSDWNAVSGMGEILNKPNLATVATTGNYSDLNGTPTIPAAQVNSDWNANSGVSQILNKPNLATVATSGSYNDLQDKPSIPAAQVNSDWNSNSGASEILNKPSLATVATSGSYSDLTNKPTIPTVPTNVSAFNNDAGYTTFDGDYNSLTNKPTIPAAQVQSDWNAVSGMGEILNKPSLATVATSGDYDDLQNKPSIPAAQIQSDWNQSDNTQLDYIKNKPTIPAAPVQSDWNESDTSSLAYIANKPNIPAAQVQTDWNAVSGMGQLLNKPSMTSETWTFSVDDGQGGTTTVTKTVWLQPTV